MPRFALLLLVLLTGCPDPPPIEDAGPMRCPIGDPALPMQMEIVHRTIDGGIETTLDDGIVPLVEPPQGGKVLLVSVRARNVDGCSVVINASIRDECNDRVIALEKRPIFLEDRGDGWGEPKQPVEISNYSNLPACPRVNADRDIEGEPYLLRITLTDRDHEGDAGVSSSLRIMPVCSEPTLYERCLCECDHDYRLGEACGPDTDSGVAPGTCPPRG